jgi:aminoglycoside phosphotransferase (APT) family kinase protein
VTTPPGAGTPKAEIDVTEDMVRALLNTQHPDLAGLDLRMMDAGWDNAMCRLGDDLVVRLPRRTMAADLVLNEQKWLPKLSARLPVTIPVPQYVGVPGDGYPWHWSVVPWIEGKPADINRPNKKQGEVLADFLGALHQKAPDNAPHNPYRGVRLNNRADAVEDRMIRLARETDLITRPIAALWQQALSVDIDRPDCWIHGDLHGRNVLADDAGNIAGIIDWGDICAGDRATDLASVWTLLPDAEARADVMEYYEAGEKTWQRAAGWAVMYGVVLSDAGRIDTPHFAEMGADILARLETDMA